VAQSTSASSQAARDKASAARLPAKTTGATPQTTPQPTATQTRSTTVSTPTRANTTAAAPAGRSIAEALATGNSSPWSVAVGLTLLTLVPAILLAMTPLVRLLVVFHFLRQALGTQTAPSNQILMALGLMMTWFLMQPVITQVNEVALAPYRAGTLAGEDAIERGAVPMKSYMLRYARDKDLELFASASQAHRMVKRDDAPMQVVVPAYMLSELKAGFQIGAILFLPFLLIDLVVASVTTSVGMLQMPPTVISTPVKILLFVMVDGWHLLASSLLKSF
jgi:flagellar biosynthetic protein FliP